jgi:hypothetical protein
VFVIVRERQTAEARIVRVWLNTLVPTRWGERVYAAVE